jgi:hypothetical protein
LDAHIAQTDPQTSAIGAEFMEPPKPLKATLEAIRDLATNALNQNAKSQEEYSMRWKCKDCQYTKHFTRPDGKRPRSPVSGFVPARQVIYFKLRNQRDGAGELDCLFAPVPLLLTACFPEGV